MSTAQTIYAQLRQAGLTEAAALGMLGNWQCESGLEPNRLQGDYSPYRTVSKEYVARAESGQMSKEEFCKPVGVFLAQWTYPARKAALWDYWKRSGKKLDSAEMQTDFALKELREDYPALLKLLCSSTDLYECTKRICTDFERPAVNNVDQRFRAAKDIKQQINLGDTVSAPQEGWEKIPATDYWPPRTICNGMKGPDVEVLQAVLKARGWIVTNPDGVFGSYLTEKVKAFQETAFPDNSSEWDGIVGPKTWEKLLNIGG